MKVGHQPQFQKLFLRLGGLHQLMSFLGAGCKLMEGSGLEELWETAYALKSIPKMMEGKAYAKTLRACLLTDAALHLVLMQGGDGEQTLSQPDDTLPSSSEHLEDDCQDADSTSVCESNNADHNAARNRAFPSGEDSYIHGTVDANTNGEGTLWQSLKQLYQSISSNEILIDDVDQNQHLHDFHKRVCDLMDLQEESRTGKLWIMFMKIVSIVRQFILAERCGVWQLHVQATQEMLPYLTAAGHNNYAKCCRLYLQDCQDLCQCFIEPFEKGLFTNSFGVVLGQT